MAIGNGGGGRGREYERFEKIDLAPALLLQSPQRLRRQHLWRLRRSLFRQLVCARLLEGGCRCAVAGGLCARWLQEQPPLPTPRPRRLRSRALTSVSGVLLFSAGRPVHSARDWELVEEFKLIKYEERFEKLDIYQRLHRLPSARRRHQPRLLQQQRRDFDLRRPYRRARLSLRRSRILSRNQIDLPIETTF